MTEYEMLKTALIRVVGDGLVRDYEWEDGTFSLGVTTANGGEAYYEFDKNGKMTYCTHDD